MTMSRERSVIDEFNIERQIQRLWEYAGLNTKTMALVQDQCHGLRSLQLHSQEWMDNQVEVPANCTPLLHWNLSQGCIGSPPPPPPPGRPAYAQPLSP